MALSEPCNSGTAYASKILQECKDSILVQGLARRIVLGRPNFSPGDAMRISAENAEMLPSRILVRLLASVDVFALFGQSRMSFREKGEARGQWKMLTKFSGKETREEILLTSDYLQCHPWLA